MARKNILYSFAMIDAESTATNLTSDIVPVATLDNGSIYVAWSGTTDGELQVEAKNGENAPWYVVDMGGTILLDGSGTSHQLIFNQMPFTHIRLQYIRSAGTGTLDAIITAKQVGG